MSLNNSHQKSRSLEKLAKARVSGLRSVKKPSQTQSTSSKLNSSLKPKLHKSSQNSISLKPILSQIPSKNSLSLGSKLIKRKKVLSKVASPTNISKSSVLSPVNSRIAIQIKKMMTAKEVLSKHSNELTAFELSEIVSYKEIYYIGLKSNKITGKKDLPNFGYDDNNGNLKLLKGDHIAYRFEVLRMIGKGTFGQVFECFDHKRSEKVALKVIRNKKRYYKQASIELSILFAIRETDLLDDQPVIKLKNHFIYRMHICMVFPLFHYNLYEVIKFNNFKGLSLGLVRRFASQILKALVFASNLNIVHCDLKPENILLKSALKSEIVVIDFGSSAFEYEKVHTYIQSRFYRAPEVILETGYDRAIDMWSFACVVAELVIGAPLLPGESEFEQFALMVEIFGMPEKELVERSEKFCAWMKGSGDEIKLDCGREIEPNSRKLEDILKSPDSDLLDLLTQCFQYNSSKRLTPQQALSHSFFQNKSS